MLQAGHRSKLGIEPSMRLAPSAWQADAIPNPFRSLCGGWSAPDRVVMLHFSASAVTNGSMYF
jgi:hypothetical protein